MKSLLAKVALRHGIGVYIGDHDVVVCKLASTPLGTLQLATEREAYTSENLNEVLQRLLTPLMGNRKRFPLPVALGLPGQRIFFSTRPIKSSNSEASPEMLLHEAFQSASISVDDMALDVIKGQPEKRPVASIAACRRKYLTGLLNALRGANVNPQRAEPVPTALLRVAIAECKGPRKAKTVVRLFLGGDQCLAILTVSNLPCVWRYFPLRAGEESNLILSAVRTLMTLCKPCGIAPRIDAVIIHGPQESRGDANLETLTEDLGIPMSWHVGPGLDEGVIARGLAMGCLSSTTEAFDLARSLKPRRSLWELFPWGETALQGAMLVCMGLFLAERSSSLNKSYASVKQEIASHVWMENVPETELLKEKKELEGRVDAIRRFMGTRILWTSYMRDIPTRLPANANISALEGICDLEIATKKKDGIKTKKFFLIRATAPIHKNGVMPPEIDLVLQALRSHPLLKKDFPNVEPLDVKWYQPYSGARPIAMFAVNCLPKAAGPGAAPKSAEAN